MDSTISAKSDLCWKSSSTTRICAGIFSFWASTLYCNPLYNLCKVQYTIFIFQYTIYIYGTRIAVVACFEWNAREVEKSKPEADIPRGEAALGNAITLFVSRRARRIPTR